MLTETDNPPQLALLSAKSLNESIPSFRETADFEELVDRGTALEPIDLPKNPHRVICLERPHDTKSFRVLIEGRIKAPTGNDQNLIPGFEREYYNIKGFALLENNTDTCYIASDILGIVVATHHPALFQFTYSLPFTCHC